MLHFGRDIDTTVREYYRYVASRVNIGGRHVVSPDAGYLLSPETCARIAAECRNVVAIKYSVPREMYAELTEMTRDSLIVSTASEAEWLDNIIELGWRLYLCSIPPILFQTRTDRRMQQYTELAFQGRLEEAPQGPRQPRARQAGAGALASARHPHAQQKYWQELLGQVGGPVRRPLLPLAGSERAAIRLAFEQKRPGGSTGSSVREHMKGELKVAMVGFGAIGRSLATLIREQLPQVSLIGVAKRSPPGESDRAAVQAATQFVDTPAALAELPADLVIECAGHQALAAFAPVLLGAGARDADRLGGRPGRPGTRGRAA